jgi:type II restriction enzyme
VTLQHDKSWRLLDIVGQLQRDFPDVRFHEPHKNRWLEPDGGVLSIVDKEGCPHVVLISEVKNQGTNDERAKKGKKKQAMGNAIERLGKNMIGFRAAMLSESIVPFVCFGYGYDFKDGSYILDRVRTIAMFGPLNEICLMNEGEAGQFNRGSFYFREKPWTKKNMADVLYQVACRSVYYYFAKCGPEVFEKPA